MTYKTSKDYERLARLVESGMLVVGANGEVYAMSTTKGGMYYRGGYGQIVWFANSRDEFIYKCQKHESEFIDPASQVPPNLWHGPEERPEANGAEKILSIWKHPEDVNFRVDIETAYMYNLAPEYCIRKRWAYVDELIKATGDDK